MNTVLTDVDGEKPFAGTLPAAREGGSFLPRRSPFAMIPMLKALKLSGKAMRF